MQFDITCGYSTFTPGFPNWILVALSEFIFHGTNIHIELCLALQEYEEEMHNCLHPELNISMICSKESILISNYVYDNTFSFNLKISMKSIANSVICMFLQFISLYILYVPLSIYMNLILGKFNKIILYVRP